MNGKRLAAVLAAVLTRGCGGEAPSVRDGGADAVLMDDREVCPPGQSECGGTCVDLRRNREHCGACERICPAGSPCVGGVCQIRCAAPETACGDACFDTRNDTANCGACGRACAADALCLRGACVPRCPAPSGICGGNCVDLGSSLTDCGACGVACGERARCVAGRCEPCPAEQARCGRAECGVDLRRDVRNCGGCGEACPAVPFATATCVDGRCGRQCLPGRIDCDGDMGCETDAQRDPANCGACGVRCASGQRCRAGACVPEFPRPRRPMSGAEVLTRRPRFAWVLGDGYDGARIEVCATRACGAVVRSADVTGDGYTFAEPFVPGVYFWRVRGRRGETTDSRSTVVWPFAVSGAEGPLTPERVLADYDGDGVADQTRSVAPPVHVPMRCWDGRYTQESWNHESLTIYSIGDVDGDGFGDAELVQFAEGWDCYARSTYWAGVRAFGSVAGLGRAEVTRRAYVSAGFPRILGAGAAEDYDGDGLADHLLFEGEFVYQRASLVRGVGGPPLGVGGPPPISGEFGVLEAAGDLDGDLACEVVHTISPPWERASAVFRVVAGGITEVVPPRCEVLAAELAGERWSGRALAVAPDVDRDGVVDLVANATRAGATVRVRWFGGPGAPRADRCALDAP